MPINPTMIIQLTSIGRKLIRVSSMRPYGIHMGKENQERRDIKNQIKKS